GLHRGLADHGQRAHAASPRAWLEIRVQHLRTLRVAGPRAQASPRPHQRKTLRQPPREPSLPVPQLPFADADVRQPRARGVLYNRFIASVAELVDAPRLGRGEGYLMGVRGPPLALLTIAPATAGHGQQRAE